MPLCRFGNSCKYGDKCTYLHNCKICAVLFIPFKTHSFPYCKTCDSSIRNSETKITLRSGSESRSSSKSESKKDSKLGSKLDSGITSRSTGINTYFDHGKESKKLSSPSSQLKSKLNSILFFKPSRIKYVISCDFYIYGADWIESGRLRIESDSSVPRDWRKSIKKYILSQSEEEDDEDYPKKCYLSDINIKKRIEDDIEFYESDYEDDDYVGYTHSLKLI